MKWHQAPICMAVAVMALFVEPSCLLELRTELLTFLSILFGAVMFRLGRGVPQLAMEQLGVQDVRRIADAFKEVARRLLSVFAVTGITALFLIVAEPLLALADYWPRVRQGIVFVGAFLVTFALVRAIAVVLGDRDLVYLQAELLKQDALKRHAKKATAKLDRAERENPFASSEEYGGLKKT